MLTQEEIVEFREKGFIIKKGLFSQEEMHALREAAEESEKLKTSTFSRDDGEGGRVDLALWNNVDDSIFGLFPRSERLVNRMEDLLGDEVYHYHSKLVQKNPGTGGAWTWHQDYGYWYQNGLLFPDQVGSVMIAVDKATRENGCLQVIEGSHKMGRVNHITSGEQAGADQEAVHAALGRLPHLYIELDPGDALFFHSNLLHRSDQNKSKHPRWALISCYNTKSNDPYKKSHHPSYTPLSKVRDEEVLKGFRHASEAMDWLNPDDDHSATDQLETS